MNTLHKKLIMLLACCFLLAGQFAMLAHAVDHPFHAQGEMCTSYISLEHHNPAIVHHSLNVFVVRYQDKTERDIQFSAQSASHYTTHARAPPAKA